MRIYIDCDEVTISGRSNGMARVLLDDPDETDLYGIVRDELDVAELIEYIDRDELIEALKEDGYELVKHPSK